VIGLPYFVGATTEHLATQYFTVFTLSRHSHKRTAAIYSALPDSATWEADVAALMGISADEVKRTAQRVVHNFRLLADDDLVVHRGEHLYPKRLGEVEEMPEFLFLRGDISLLDLPVVSVVGTRQPTPAGETAARDLAARLSEHHVVVASGLARGIDTAAHSGALDAVRQTVAVIGTPLNKQYPAENAALQRRIEREGLVVSQFMPGAPVSRWNFPMRNATMSGLSIATIVVEAGETSGALSQARAALKQGRKVFVPVAAVDNPSLRWPRLYVTRKGALPFEHIGDLMRQLEEARLLSSLADKTRPTVATHVIGV
jgi:DNA processing protein